MRQQKGTPKPVIKQVVFCDDALVYLDNRAIRSTTAKQYPGLSFLPLLAEKLKAEGIYCVTGDIALSKIAKGQWKAKETALVQVAGSRLGDYLTTLGVIPLITFSGESPLWIPQVYLRFDETTRKYRYRFFFSHVYKTARARPGLDQPLYFPSFSKNDILRHMPYGQKRRKVVAVLANKYYANTQRRSLKRSIVALLRALAKPFYRLQSILFPQTLRLWGKQAFYFSELHSRRLALMDYLCKMRLLDVYGPGWDDISNLPPKQIPNLAGRIGDIYHGPVKDKIATLRQYQFCLCLENISFPSYVTEKIFDCFRAGTVPIYLGAPDIESYVPKECFIHMNRFKSKEEMFYYITNMNETEYQTYIAAGRNFLSSPQGMQFTNEHLADQFHEAIHQYQRTPEIS